MPVTAITEHPRRKGRYVVDVDGREEAVVTAEALVEVGVRVGVQLSEGQREALRAATAEASLLDRALGLLGHRARSTRELKRRLKEKGEPSEAAIDAVIARLERAGLVNDADFARQVARSKVVGQGASKRRARQELFKRGVGRDVADEAIAQVYEDESVEPMELAERAARKRLKSLAGLDSATRRRRLYGFLARRGYESDEIRSAMDAVLGRGGAEGSADGQDTTEE